MANHKQPTKEEIEADIIKAQKEIDNPPAPSPSAPAPTPSPSTPPPSPSEAAPSPSPSEAAPTPSPSEAPPSPSPSAPEPSKEVFKKKFKNSTREALVQKAGRDNLTNAIETADKIPEPTEEELKAEYGEDWDVMSDNEQKNAKKIMISDRRWELINKANQESKDLNTWIKKVDDYIEDPKVLSDKPELEGKADEFRSFAITPSRRGIPLEDLVKIFLFDATKTVTKKKGQMFERPGGKGGKPVEPDKYSAEEAERLRDKNYDAYKVYIKKHEKAIRSGKIGV